ncbi:MAG: hypothetical protein WDN69_04750 [Aliidongia sp.]
MAGSRNLSQETIDEDRLISRLTWRLMPLLTILFLVAFIDRQNVGFAKLQMVGALGLTEADYGLGSSLFFISYLVFENSEHPRPCTGSARATGWPGSCSPGAWSRCCSPSPGPARASTGCACCSALPRPGSIPACSIL